MGPSTPTLISFLFAFFVTAGDSQPLNTVCENATVIPIFPSLPYLVQNLSFFVLNNYNETADPIPSCYESFQTPNSILWYSWEPNVTDLFQLSTVGSRSEYFANRNLVAVFERNDTSSCISITETACNRLGLIRDFQVEAGKKYIIQVANNPFDLEGNLIFSISRTPPPPPNDECIAATVIPSAATFPYTIGPIDFIRATSSVNETLLTCSIYGDDGETLWFEWTPTTSGLYDVGTLGSTDAFGEYAFVNVGVYQGSNCGNIVEIACDESRVLQNNLQAGQRYFIKLAYLPIFIENSSPDKVRLTIRPSDPIPPNYKCKGAIPIDPLVGETVQGNITDSERSTFWYKFTNGPDFANLNVSNSDVVFIQVFETLGLDAANCETDAIYFECDISNFITAPNTSYFFRVRGRGRYAQGTAYTGNFSVNFQSRPNYFTLIDAEANEVISVLTDFRYGLSGVYVTNLNIQASFSKMLPVQSVRMTFDYPPRSFCEEKAPYSLFGDRNGDYFNASIPLGTHLVTATPYAHSGCKNPLNSGAIQQTFTVEGCFFYIEVFNATSDEQLTSLWFNWETTFPCEANIKVTPTCGFTVKYLKLVLRDELNNKVVYSRTERASPYFLFGDINGNVLDGYIPGGSYSLIISVNEFEHTPYPFNVSDVCLS
jgi:hypothetical protein